MRFSNQRELGVLIIAVILLAVAFAGFLVSNAIETSVINNKGADWDRTFAIPPYMQTVHWSKNENTNKTFVSINVGAIPSAGNMTTTVGSDDPRYLKSALVFQGGFMVSIHKDGGLSESDLELGTLGSFIFPTIPYERVDADTLVVYCDDLIPTITPIADGITSGDNRSVMIEFTGSVYLSGRLLTEGIYTFSFAVVDDLHRIASNVISFDVPAT